MSRLSRTACTLSPFAALLLPWQPAAAASTGVQSGSATLVLMLCAACLLAGLVLQQRLQPLLHAARRALGNRRLQRAVKQAQLEFADTFILPGTPDGLSRIDLAVLTSAGIACVRAIHGNGLVFGSADEAQWSQVDGISQRRILNPVIQNEGRVRSIRRVVDDMPVINLVVFTGKVEFAVTPPSNVIPLAGLQAWFADHAGRNACATDPEASWLTLKAAALTDAASQRDFEAQLSFG